jgi:hypothetical protein
MVKAGNHQGVDAMNNVVVKSRKEWVLIKKGIEADGGRSRTMRERDGSVTMTVVSKLRVGDRPAVIIEVFNW